MRRYAGNFSDYAEKRGAERREEKRTEAKPAAPAAKPERRERKPRFSFKEQREYETIDAEIAALEEKQAVLEAEIAANSSDYVRLQELMDEKAKLEAEQEYKLERWVYLNELAEKIAAQEDG